MCSQASWNNHINRLLLASKAPLPRDKYWDVDETDDEKDQRQKTEEKEEKGEKDEEQEKKEKETGEVSKGKEINWNSFEKLTTAKEMLSRDK